MYFIPENVVTSLWLSQSYLHYVIPTTNYEDISQHNVSGYL